MMSSRLIGVVPMVEDEQALEQEEGEKPAPTSAVTRVGSPTLSIASGSTSKSATATTMPPVSAITVGSE